MKFYDYHINDFLLDEAFIDWVKTGRPYEELQNWILENPENIEKVNKAKSLVQSISFNELTFSDREKNLLFASIEQGTKRSFLTTEKGGFKFWRLSQIAAAVVIMTLSGVFLYRNLNSLGTEETDLVAENTAPEMVEKFSPKGVKTSLVLMDGTSVKLNADSKLTFPQSFGNNKREVFLEGEAFFDVSKDENRPFIINTGKVKTTVLGTSFNIKAFPEDEDVQVAVASGKVAVAYQEETSDNNVNPSQELFLLPEEMSTFSKKDRRLVKSEFDRKQVLSWKDNILYFENASFEEVKEKLERWYGVNFLLKGKPLESEFEGEFHNESLKAVLEGLSFSVKFDFLIEDKIVTIINK
ncbi:FecR family protein [Flexithrix dorotheae]|uniref:FecR family protein n=1 Tax=Flexithrix dorotheae TaxID=70993 RepID=UPI000361BBB2|nr:FecR family protein [Flexithrix dorotheae]